MSGTIRVTNARTDGMAAKGIKITKGGGHRPQVEDGRELPAGKSRGFGGLEAGEYTVSAELADGTKATAKATVTDAHEAAVSI